MTLKIAQGCGDRHSVNYSQTIKATQRTIVRHLHKLQKDKEMTTIFFPSEIICQMKSFPRSFFVPVQLLGLVQ